MRTQAFQGLIPAPGRASEVATVPYDVVNTEEARALAKGRPYDLLHVDRAEIDLPPDTDPYSDLVYETALANFRRLQRDGLLRRESQPSIYLYQQIMGEHRQTGIALACHIDDYGEDIIRKHEKTRKVKEDDRTRLVDTLSAHTGPIFLTYRDRPTLDSLVAKIQAERPPDVRVVDERQVEHLVWTVPGGEEFLQEFTQVPLAYVADGHHRSASAWRVGSERRARNPKHTGEEGYNYFLGVLFPASQLRIMPYNRLVKDLAGLSQEGFLAKIKAAGVIVEPSTETSPTRPGQACLYLGGKWFILTWPTVTSASPIEQLDVSRLQDLILSPILGIHDPRTDERIDFVGGIRGTEELVRRVDSGECAAAFSLYPVTVDQLMGIADAGEIMPPKSTWFEPKLRSGLFVMTLD